MTRMSGHLLTRLISVLLLLCASRVHAIQTEVSESNDTRVTQFNFTDHSGLSKFIADNKCHLAVISASWFPNIDQTAENRELMISKALEYGWTVMEADVGTKDEYEAYNYLKDVKPYNVINIPSYFMVVGGKVTSEIKGVAVFDEKQLNSMITKLVNGPPEAKCYASVYSERKSKKLVEE